MANYLKALNSRFELAKAELANCEEKKVGGLTLPDFETCYKPAPIQKLWSRHGDRNTDPWDRIESTEINLIIWVD